MTVLPERRIGREWDWLADSGSHEPSEECSHAYIRSRVALGDGDAGGDASESSVCALLGAGTVRGKPYTYRICLDCDERVRDTAGAWRAQ